MYTKSLQACLTLRYSHGLQPTRLLCPWDSPSKNTALLQGIFLTQQWNPRLLCLLHWQAGSLQLAPLGNERDMDSNRGAKWGVRVGGFNTPLLAMERSPKQGNTALNDTLDCCCCCCEVTSVVSNSVRPHRRQPTRLPRPWDSPGKNTGVGCHFLLRCMKVKSEREVAQSCPTLSDPMDCSLPGSSVHGIFQARVLE